MRYEFTGTVKVVFDTQTFASGFTKREFVVTDDDPKYPQDVKFQVVKERTALLDSLQPGDRVSITFGIRGNEFKDRYYVDLSAWEIRRESGGSSADSSAPGDADEAFETSFDVDDDVPF